MYGDFVFSLLAYEGRIYAGATLDVFAGTETGDRWTWSALNSPGPDGYDGDPGVARIPTHGQLRWRNLCASCLFGLTFPWDRLDIVGIRIASR